MASELNPQQLDFMARYLKPDSETYGNAYASAIAAGYKKEYAEVILKRAPWMSEIIGDKDGLKTEILNGIKRETEWAGDGRAQDAQVRLKAWELMGKSQKLFTEKVEHSGEATLNVNIVRYDND